MANYIKEVRDLVGHKPLILNAAAGIVANDQHEVDLEFRDADTLLLNFIGHKWRCQ